MAYVLVLLRAGENAEDEPAYASAHETFITSLIRRNSILLGGALSDPVDDVYAAYLLRCEGVDAAREIAAEDPFVVNGVLRPHCVEWRLVGINPEAIEDSEVLRPGDV